MINPAFRPPQESIRIGFCRCGAQLVLSGESLENRNNSEQWSLVPDSSIDVNSHHLPSLRNSMVSTADTPSMIIFSSFHCSGNSVQR